MKQYNKVQQSSYSSFSDIGNEESCLLCLFSVVFLVVVFGGLPHKAKVKLNNCSAAHVGNGGVGSSVNCHMSVNVAY